MAVKCRNVRGGVEQADGSGSRGLLSAGGGVEGNVMMG